jgi:hypothetical protein
MAVKVFLSWSGTLSKDIAEATRKWLPGVLQFVKPYFTPDDVEKGARWDSDISKELETSNIGVIFLTKENLYKPWILFEAGALSKKLEKAKVCTALFGVEPADIEGPLVSFQHTKFEKIDFKKLLTSINKEAGDLKLDQSILDEVFEMWWPRLEGEIKSILQKHKPTDTTPSRQEREILEEILELSRLTARHASGDRFHPEALHELFEHYSLMAKAIEDNDLAKTREFSDRLARPIHYICRGHEFRKRPMARLRPQLFDITKSSDSEK